METASMTTFLPGTRSNEASSAARLPQQPLIYPPPRRPGQPIGDRIGPNDEMEFISVLMTTILRSSRYFSSS
ncbi:hypothetical protein Q1695_013934 [Nippostrongylus brasiliensis]|nr:hypothetical protein Q1695_013934 [Nippostrongylus brasiliensis]